MLRHFAAALLIALTGVASAPAWAAPIDDAIQLINKGEHAAAARILSPLADANNAEAQYRLGLLYYNGQGIKESEQKAYQLLLRSANQGHTEAMVQLAHLLNYSNEAPKFVSDPDTEAANWYLQAAQKGHPEAQYSIAILIITGKIRADQSDEKNRKAAEYWMKEAAKNGHKEAQAYVGQAFKNR